MNHDEEIGKYRTNFWIAIRWSTAAIAQDDTTTVDLSTKLDAAIENNETVTSGDLQLGQKQITRRCQIFKRGQKQKE